MNWSWSRFAGSGHPSTGCLVLGLLSWLAGTSDLSAQSPLHERIDQLIEAPPAPPLADICSDAEFLRRIYLDLTGAIPTVSEARAFLADQSPGKRAAVVNRLLASPRFSRHMATTFDVILMERRSEKQVKHDEWAKYLYDSFAQNKPWDQLAREILAADGTDEKIRPAAKFYLDRDGEPNLLTRDVGRIFFGMDMACCQCHDHPLVGTYEQSDYYGIYAFLSRGTLFTNKEKKVFYAEKAEGDAKFTSVFTKQQDETRPCLPGDLEITEPTFLKGNEYTVAPADNVRPVPRFSRRAVLAESATSGKNRPFNRNIANRLWALMLGRGLVEPLDMHHLDNPPAYPELLELLADELPRMKFDLRAFFRELAMTRVYQRSLQSPADLTRAIQTAAPQLSALETEQRQVSAAIEPLSKSLSTARTDYDQARRSVSAVLAELTNSNNALGAAQKAGGDAAKALAEAQQQLAVKRDVANAVAEAAAKTAEAASKLAGDAEFSQAADKFKARAGQLAGELATAEKLVVERTEPATAAANALTVAQTAAAQIAAKVTSASQRSMESGQQLAALQLDVRAKELASQSVQVRLRRARTLTELGKLLAAADASQLRAAGLQEEIRFEKQTLATLTTELPRLESAMQAASAVAAETSQKLADLQKQLADRDQAALLVADAVAKAEVAVQKLPQESELKQAADIIKSRRDKLQTEVADLRKAMAAGEQSAKAAGEQLLAAKRSLMAATTQLEGLRKTLPEKESLLPGVQSQAAADQTARQVALDRAAQQWSQHFGQTALDPLTPEQLAWSILTATGVVEQHRAAAEVEVNKTLPIDPQAPHDPAKVAEREKQIEQQLFEKLKGNVATFVTLFGHSGGQPQRDFFATVDQALFFANAGVLQGWLNPAGENLLGRLLKLNDSQQLAEELYLSLFTRLPSAEETSAVANYLQARVTDRQSALQEIAWALVTSNEFRFSY